MVGSSSRRQKGSLRSGFSTGTAATAAAVAALRRLLLGAPPRVASVRLLAGYFLPVAIEDTWMGSEGEVWASVIKDGGDDPDVTSGARICAGVRLFRHGCTPSGSGPGVAREPAGDEPGSFSGICLIGGEGVGVATKPGLPVKVGEPAINPGPREMLVRNLTDEILRWEANSCSRLDAPNSWRKPDMPHICLSCGGTDGPLSGLTIEVRIEVPRGKALASHTLNPRLGIVGGISILGTTGIVKPFSHKAYEETIDVALSVASSNKCKEVVLSTGGKSEHFAQAHLSHLPTEAFVQIADFFAYGVERAREMGFERIVHSAFFGKVVKMAQGHRYTHAHEVPLDLLPLARLAGEQCGYDEAFCDVLASANTARHALELLLHHQAMDVVQAVTRQAALQAARLAGNGASVRLLLFDYGGELLSDERIG